MLQPVAPSRRSVLRAAAWAAPAVSVAVAAPAYATSHQNLTGAVTSTAPVKYSQGQQKFVRWDLTINNTTATMSLAGIVIAFTYSETSGEGATVMTITPTAGGGTWTNGTGLTATYSSVIAPHGSISLRVVFTASNNSGGSVACAVTAGGVAIGTTEGAFVPLKGN